MSAKVKEIIIVVKWFMTGKCPVIMSIWENVQNKVYKVRIEFYAERGFINK